MAHGNAVFGRYSGRCLVPFGAFCNGALQDDRWAAGPAKERIRPMNSASVAVTGSTGSTGTQDAAIAEAFAEAGW